MGFVENLILFLTVQNCESWFTFNKFITDYVMSCFFYGPQNISQMTREQPSLNLLHMLENCIKYYNATDLLTEKASKCVNITNENLQQFVSLQKFA